MRGAYRTPSPEKLDTEGNRKHSPWTAQRARKKGRCSPSNRLPEVEESLQEGCAGIGGKNDLGTFFPPAPFQIFPSASKKQLLPARSPKYDSLSVCKRDLGRTQAPP